MNAVQNFFVYFFLSIWFSFVVAVVLLCFSCGNAFYCGGGGCCCASVTV